jgi:hypothetical protein
MTAKHNLDSVGAANATVWADDVDDSVNRLSGLTLGRLTNVAGTNAITGRLPMSSGFTAISDGAIFSFIPAANNTGAVTMQLQDTAGSNVGSSFALRDVDGVAFAADDIVAGRLQVFQYSSTDSYARRIADASDPVVPATVISGWTLLETQEPTTDVSTITFATLVSSYKSLRVEVYAEMGTNAAYLTLRYSPDGATWRTIGNGAIATQSSGLTVNCWDIMNVDDADGTHLRVAHLVHSGTKTANADRSDAVITLNSPAIDAQAGTGGYTSYTEDMAYIRIDTSSGVVEGSTADRRVVARLYGQS